MWRVLPELECVNVRNACAREQSCEVTALSPRTAELACVRRQTLDTGTWYGFFGAWVGIWRTA